MMEHGPECWIGRREIRTGTESCQCVLCHCGPKHRPGSWLGECGRCFGPASQICKHACAIVPRASWGLGARSEPVRRKEQTHTDLDDPTRP